MTRADAIMQARFELGLDEKNRQDWTTDEVIGYNHRLAALLVSYGLTEGAENEAAIAGRDYAPGADNSFLSNLGAFGGELANEAKIDIGLGFSTLKNVLYLVAVAAVVTFVFLHFRSKST